MRDVRGDLSFSQGRGKEVIYEAGQAASQGMNIQCLATILPRGLRCEKLILNSQILYTVFRAQRSRD